MGKRVVEAGGLWVWLQLDMYGNPLTFSGTPSDTTFTTLGRLVYNPASKDSQVFNLQDDFFVGCTVLSARRKQL